MSGVRGTDTLYLFVEGSTERTFANVVIGPHLANFGVYLYKPILIANARRHGQVHRGGVGYSYQTLHDDIAGFARGQQADDVYFTTMIDFFRIHRDFPGRHEPEAQPPHSPHDRVAHLQHRFADDIGDTRFIPFIQLHEFEAYLFCGPDHFAASFPQARSEIEALSHIANGVATPEEINDGPTTAPSKRIEAIFPSYGRGKVAIGPRVAELIGLSTIRSKCPHFDAWLTRLEGLGGSQA